jgi:hypothetical protein
VPLFFPVFTRRQKTHEAPVVPPAAGELAQERA